MIVRDMVRAYLDANPGPKWSCEIISHIRSMGVPVRASIISGMVLHGALIRHDNGPGQPFGYTIGKRPPPMLTAEQKAERQRGYEAKRAIRRAEDRRARGIPARPQREQPTIRRNSIGLVSSHATVGGESVAEFLARGGQIEHLPGLQKSEVFPQRRPTWAASNRQLSA